MSDDRERKPSEVPTDSVDLDAPDPADAPAPPRVGPATAGPAVSPLDTATEEAPGAESPSEADVALEREVKAQRARPRP